METVNYADFRSNIKHWFDKVVNDVSDIIIKRKSGEDLVLISLDEYNSLKETAYLLTGKLAAGSVRANCFLCPPL